MKATIPFLSTSTHVMFLDVLAKQIANQPDAIGRLLLKHGIKTPKNSSDRSLLNRLFYAIENKGLAFHQDLAQWLYQPQSNEDAFNMGALLGKGGEAAAASVPAQNSGITVGSDPVSAIAGAIGSVANIFGNHQNRKTIKMQARSKTLQSMLAYKTQKEQQIAAKQEINLKQEKQKKLLKRVGIAAAIAVLGWLLISQTRSRPKVAFSNHQVV